MPESSNLADFYLGRGPTAVYLGTAADASPAQLDVWARFTADDPEAELFGSDHFTKAVTAAMAERADAAVGDNGAWLLWPHEHTDSGETAWSYSFDKGSLYVDRFGYQQAVIYSNQGRKPVAYPAPTTFPR